MSSIRVAAVGGGHGLATTLRAARRYSSHITAVVSTADDGGSTGRLRAVTDRPAPGDLRKCLVALASDDSLLSRAMQHRFATGDVEGHAFGNLLIVAMAEASGDLVEALDAVGDLVGAVGRVLPATSTPVQLQGSLRSGPVVHGQVALSSSDDVCVVGVVPADAAACAEAVDAILTADQVVLGPGSLYTSVLAATAVTGIRDAIVGSSGQFVYVCNLAPQIPETAGYSVADHVAALLRHGLEPDVVVHDPGVTGTVADLSSLECSTPPRVVEQPVSRASGRAHDPELLADALRSALG